MPDPLPLSVCIITKNEERHLPACLDSVRGRVAEIVVLDSLSTDRTREIAQAAGARFSQQPFRDFSSQKNACVALASHDWVLVLDADERMEESVWPLLGDLFAGGRIGEHAAYVFPRKNFGVEGRFTLCFSHYPNFVDRLFDRRRCRFVQEVHEFLEVEGSRKVVPHHILHKPFLLAETDRIKMELYTGLKRRMRERLGVRDLARARPLAARIRLKWDNLLFYNRAFFLELRLHLKGPATWWFLVRWYLVFLVPPFRRLAWCHRTPPPSLRDQGPPVSAKEMAHAP